MHVTLPLHRPARWCALSLGAVLFLAGCLAPLSALHPAQHIVLLWLKRSLRPGDRAEIARTARSLQFVPGVSHVEIGRDVSLPPALLDRSFDLAVVITFSDRAALERYEKNMRGARAEAHYLQPLVRRAVVYDFDLR